METTTNRAELLANALTAVTELSQKRQAYREEQLRFKTCEEKLETLRLRIGHEKEAAVNRRRSAMDEDYDRRIGGVEEKIEKAENSRQTARRSAMKYRITERTANLRSLNEMLKNRIGEILRRNGLAGICGTRGFLCLFNPSGIPEVLVMTAAFLLLLVGLPLLITMPIEKVWIRILIFSLMDAIFIVAYFLIYASSTMKKPKAIAECHDIQKSIAGNKKEMARIARAIRNDPDDSCYNLNGFDSEITRLSQEKNNIVSEKIEAGNEFEAKTSFEIRAEIDEKYREQLEAVKTEFAESTENAKRLYTLITAEEKAINEAYAPYIDAKDLNREGITRLMEQK